MDPANPADRIALAVIVFAVLLVVLGASAYVGMTRDRERSADAKKIREEDRVFLREMIGILATAIRSESALRLAAENDRLHRRTVRPSE